MLSSFGVKGGMWPWPILKERSDYFSFSSSRVHDYFWRLPLKVHFEECNGGIPVAIFIIEKRSPFIKVVEENRFHLPTVHEAKVDHFLGVHKQFAPPQK